MNLQNWLDKYRGKVSRTVNGLTEVLSTAPDLPHVTVILPRPVRESEMDIYRLDDFAVSGRYGVHTFGMVRI